MFSTLANYINVLKPRETLLLAFIGAATLFIAARGVPPWDTLLLTTLAILIASAAANGFTNYLDRNLDCLMPRTRNRALAARRIKPAEKVLPMLFILAAIGLGLAWLIHPYVFLADLVGTLVAVTFRKKVTCVFPQGAIAGCAPVLMGWFAVEPSLNWQIGLICLLIIVWLPSHVWGVMIARREEYINAGITFFPMSASPAAGIRLMVFSGVVLFATSIALYFVADFGWLYLSGAVLLGLLLLASSFKLLKTSDSNRAWRVYKISSFPYLGLLFLVMVLDLLLL
ncbi:MAG: UbiA family prenyltransferase [Dehalococcoidales bacterium]|nr:UbiA family prenyltransferase [Dehalococcoidales bacterium]MDD4794130.1 UbiA family prenyltransferase [Dehalococcoidales bacterium]